MGTSIRPDSTWKYVQDCLENRRLGQPGYYVQKVEQFLTQRFGSSHGIATSSFFASILLALRLVELQPKDYVLIPSLAPPDAAHATRLLGADPIFFDAQLETWQVDLNLLEEFLMNYTYLNDRDQLVLKRDKRIIRAVLSGHLAGGMVNMDRLLFIAHRFNLQTVELANAALGTTLAGKSAGTFGRVGCLSFQPDSVISSGDGGLVLIQEDMLASRARYLTSGLGHTDYGEAELPFEMLELTAAVVLAQVEQLDFILEQQQIYFKRYTQMMEGNGLVTCPSIEDQVRSNRGWYSFLSDQRDQLIRALEDEQLPYRLLPKPLQLQPSFKGSLFINRDNQALHIYQKGICLPTSPALPPKTHDRILELARQILA